MMLKVMKFMKNRPKGDVEWYAPNRKKPIAYSTIATSEYIVMLAQNGGTIKDIYEKIAWYEDAKSILEKYIQLGYGEKIAAEWFKNDEWRYLGNGIFQNGQFILQSEYWRENDVTFSGKDK